MKSYSISERGVDNYIKAARVVVAERHQRAEAIRAEVEAQQIEEVARKLGIDRERVLAELAKVAFMDIRKLYTEGGAIKSFSELDDETAGAIAGVEVFEERDSDGSFLGMNRKVKTNPKLTALEQICKLMGWTQTGTQIKAELEDKKADKIYKVTLNLG